MMFLYLVGKFVAAGAGRMFWNVIEAIIQRVPIIRAVYSAVKQVTDFAFKERELSYTRHRCRSVSRAKARGRWASSPARAFWTSAAL